MRHQSDHMVGTLDKANGSYHFRNLAVLGTNVSHPKESNLDISRTKGNLHRDQWL